MRQRELNHEMRNLAAKLTPAERRAKRNAKLQEDTSRQVYVAVFRIKDFTDPKHRYLLLYYLYVLCSFVFFKSLNKIYTLRYILFSSSTILLRLMTLLRLFSPSCHRFKVDVNAQQHFLSGTGTTVYPLLYLGCLNGSINRLIMIFYVFSLDLLV